MRWVLRKTYSHDEVDVLLELLFGWDGESERLVEDRRQSLGLDGRLAFLQLVPFLHQPNLHVWI